MSGEHIRAIPQDRSFTRKQIAVTFNIALPGGVTRSLTLESDYQMRGTVQHSGMSVGSELELDIWGMSMDDMNRLSYVANQPNVENPRTTNQSNSTVIVRVGDYGQPLTTLFIGLLDEGWANYSGGEPVFHLHARTISAIATKVPPALSYSGPRSVVSILSDICAAAGLQLIDHGGWDRYSTLANVYLEGSPLDMLRDVVEYSCRGSYNFTQLKTPDSTQGVGFSGVIEVWGPAYGGVSTDLIKGQLPLISAETGLIDYPQYSRSGVNFSCLLRPDLAYYGTLQLKSRYEPAGWRADASGLNQQGQLVGVGNAPWSGYWLAMNITHEISSEMHGGPWFTHVECQRTNLGEKIAVKAG